MSRSPRKMTFKISRPLGWFGFEPGSVLGNKYVVLDLLGSGWEGEVYKLRERSTGIERAGKFFFPKRNLGNKTINFYARKLHKLRHCPIVTQYHTQEIIQHHGEDIPLLVSELVEGELLSTYIDRQPGKKLSVFQGLVLLHSLAAGVEHIHERFEYHGDLHTDNIIVRQHGLGFEVKLIDMFSLGTPRAESIRWDVCSLVRILYDAVGGKKAYPKLPAEVKAICCGLRRTLICRKFRTAGQLRFHLENINWNSQAGASKRAA